MKKNIAKTRALQAFMLVAALSMVSWAADQERKASYLAMAPLDQYLMADRDT